MWGCGGVRVWGCVGCVGVSVWGCGGVEVWGCVGVWGCAERARLLRITYISKGNICYM